MNHRFPRQRFNAELTVIALTLLVAVLVGAVIAMFPVGSVFWLVSPIFAALFATVVIALPNRDPPPYRTLLTFFMISMALFFLWPKYAYLPIKELPTKSPQKMFYGLTVVLCLFYFATSQEIRSRFATRLKAHPWLTFMAFSWFGWRYIASAFSLEPGYSYVYLVQETLEYLFPFLLAVSLVRDRSDVDRCINFMIFVALVVCLLGMVEWQLQRNLFEPFITIDADRQDAFAEVLGAKLREGRYRLKSSFTHPLLLAEFLVMILPLLAFRLQHTRLLGKLLCAVLAVLVLVVLALSNSRSVFVTLAVVVFGYFGAFMARAHFRHKFNAKFVLSILSIPVVIAIGAVGYIVLAQLAGGHSAEEYSSSFARIVMLRQGLPLVAESPVVGYGAGLGAYKLGFRGEGNMITLDNYYLMLTLDTGIPSLLLLVGLFAWSLLQFLKAIPLLDSEEYSRIAAISMAIAAFAVFRTILGTPHNFTLFFFLLGLLAGLTTKDDGRSIPRNRVGQAAG